MLPKCFNTGSLNSSRAINMVDGISTYSELRSGYMKTDEHTKVGKPIAVLT
jgi:predicted NUDIX family phosphoesterase